MNPVAFVSPTLGRPEYHESLYANFNAQTLCEKRLYVLDESPRRSPFFSRLTDSAVVYKHAPAPPSDGVTHIGRARNALNAMTSEPVIMHLDDDDIIEPRYGQVMLDRLLSSGAHLVKLGKWRALMDNCVFEWDTREMGGVHWTIQGGAPTGLVELEDADVEPALVEAYRDGWGFSYCYVRSLWESIPFPDAGTEDYPWVRSCRQAGARVELVNEMPELVLHRVHEKSQSMLFPQRRLGHWMRRNLLGFGAMPSPPNGLHELPDGKDVTVHPGARYVVLASLHKRHTLPSIVTRAKSWGIDVGNAEDNVDPGAFGVSAPGGDYRLVYFEGSGGDGGAVKMPWTTNKLFRWKDKSSCVRVWSERAPGLGSINEQLAPAT